jgi:hypothetical protein
MTSRRIIRFLMIGWTGAWMACPDKAGACAACFGKSDSAMAQGMNMGILSLLIVVVMVLSTIASFFVFLARKSSAASSISSNPIATNNETLK